MTVITVTFLLAHGWYTGASYSWSTAGAGFSLGLIGSYTMIFARPTLVGSFMKPAIALAVMMLIAFGMTESHGALADSGTAKFSIVLCVALIGSLGGLAFYLVSLCAKGEFDEQ